MRRYWSVMLLGARGVCGKLLALLAVLAASEAVLVALRGLPAACLSNLLQGSCLSYAFRAALLALAVICCLWGSDLLGGVRCRYTLERLRVGELTVVVLWGLCYALAFLILMGFQLVCLLAVSRWYLAAGSGTAGPQSLFLAAYADPLFHALLPLEDWGLYVRNGMYALSLGLCCSMWSFWSRRSGWGWALYGVAALAAITFPSGIGSESGGLVLGLVALAVALGALVPVWKEVRRGED
ncbi:hypothetical protein [Dysosmobacter sp.]|uniref:hypothetical protein n=1 Tax=Dysosmobacter sp. TaxID=2591382 RepID=UPI001BB47899|nr:hypothetical protein [Dysosmobacter sp.]MCI6055307.1 hypothetical protein [Dysosmobacter sp.]MDY5509019.1 hypothetical protein [Dysosmobacter sp.]QUO38277.1 hypothetical protein KFE19_01770 [Dysosmobacter sp. Marseille-Q4140]